MKSRLAQLRSDVTVAMVMLIGAFVLTTIAIMPQRADPQEQPRSQHPLTTTGD